MCALSVLIPTLASEDVSICVKAHTPHSPVNQVTRTAPWERAKQDMAIMTEDLHEIDSQFATDEISVYVLFTSTSDTRQHAASSTCVI